MKSYAMQTLAISLAGGLLAGVVLFSSLPAGAGEIESSLARGGQLYDKWFKVTGAPKPKDTHKAWPDSNTKKKGNVTWRCKSCHGWDGMGKDGAYGKGSYKTGIIGVNGMWGAAPEKIVAVMKDSTHGLAGMMKDGDFNDIANFVSKGMVDMRKYIDYATKKPKGGNLDNGAAIYNTVCFRCHAMDGSKPKDMDKTLGKQMGNPWEVLHKIMNGHPGERMPALRVFGPQVSVDIMAYLETLPKKK